MRSALDYSVNCEFACPLHLISTDYDQEGPNLYKFNKGETFGITLQKSYKNFSYSNKSLIRRIEIRVRRVSIRALIILGKTIKNFSQLYNPLGAQRRKLHQLYQDKIAESHRVRFLKTYIENNFKHFEKPEYASFVKENQSKEEHIKELDQQQPPVYHLNRGEKFGLSLQKYFLNCHLEKRTFLSKIEERVKLFVLKRLCLMGIYIQKISQKFNSDGTKRRLLLNLSNDYYAEYKKIFRINILKQANDCTSMKNIIYSTTLNSNDYKSAVEKYENCISNLLNCENERKDVLQSLEKYEQAHVNPMEYRHALKVNSLKANWLIKFDFDEQLVIKIKDVKERVKFMDLTRSYYESITKRWDTFDPC